MVEQVRSFNRTVTQRVGALDDHFLGRDRPLGEARVLWEIGADGCEVRALRARLGLDSGYLSRLLRSLEADGLITVDAERATTGASASRAPRPRAGRSGRSSTAAATSSPRSLLEPLTAASASGWSRRWARSSGCSPPRWSRSRPTTPSTPTRGAASRAYFAELERRFGAGFDPRVGSTAEPRRAAPARRRVSWSPTCAAAGRLRRPQAPPAASRSRSSGCGSPSGARARARPAAAAELEARAARARRAHRAAGDEPTCCTRRSRSTAAPATPRCPPSTTSRTPTTGSRRTLA